MAKCWKCEKKGMFLQLSSAGLCINCLEEASESAANIIKMLKKGGLERKKALEIIDGLATKEMTEAVEDKISSSPFGIWANSVHQEPGQADRIRRSASVKILEYNNSTQTATIEGSGTYLYTTTFSKCTCGDFMSRRLPCKHMYKLAAMYGNIDLSKHL